MPTRRNVEPDDILKAIVRRIRDQVQGATESTCFLTDDPETIAAGLPGEIWYTVAPGQVGKFDESMFDGGGIEQAFTTTDVAVTIHNVAINEQIGRGTRLFTDKSKSIYHLATPVLKALAGHELLDEDGTALLAQPIFPSDYSVTRDPEKRTASIQLAFSIAFDWDLS